MSQCGNTTWPGLTALTALGAGTYQGYEGGLYPGGVNTVPASHAAYGALATANVVRRGTSGAASPAGYIVLLAIGMSNTRQEFGRFMRLDNEVKQPYVIPVNGGQPSRDASTWATDDAVWTTVNYRLQALGVTANQVQWIWIKLAEADESGAFPTHAQTMQANLKALVLDIATRFPYCQGIAFSSRTYGGYANPGEASMEPWAYEGGFAVKWLIESQINGTDPDLAYGDVPWLQWGPYLWANGTTASPNGTTWNCADFEDDGLHPAGIYDGVEPPDGAEEKVAQLLIDFFTTDTYTEWFAGTAQTSVTAHYSETNTTDATSFVTASTWTPTANTLQLVSVMSRSATSPNTPTLTGHGLTYTLVTSTTFGNVNPGRLSVFRAMGAAPTVGAITTDFAGQTQVVYSISASEFDGLDTSGTAGSGAIGQYEENNSGAAQVSTLDVSLLLGQTVDLSTVYAAFASTTSTQFVPDSGWTELHDVQGASPASRLQTQYNLTFDRTATGDIQGAGTAFIAGITLELVPTVQATPYDDINTENKRRSVIHTLPAPSAAADVDEGDRIQTAGLYRMIYYPATAKRMHVVPAESRFNTVAYENRRHIVPLEDRVHEVEAG